MTGTYDYGKQANKKQMFNSTHNDVIKGEADSLL
jgi:hypothetical protein